MRIQINFGNNIFGKKKKGCAGTTDFRERQKI